MSYKEDLSIDKFSLDTEWQSQPIKFAEWAEKAVEAAFEKDKCKEQLEIVRAQVDNKIRITSTEKITEAAISGKIILSAEYQTANSKYILATRAYNLLSVGREAFDHRKKALEKMTDLFLSGYWSDRPMKKENAEALDKNNSEKARQTLNESMSVRRRKAAQANE